MPIDPSPAELPAPTSAVTVRDLLERSGGELCGAVDRAAGVAVVDVTHDSSQVREGFLFAARPGARADGHDFAPAAVRAGATALLVEHELDLPVPQIRVPSVATAMGPVAARVHGDPTGRLQLIGVTGTNGKTTTAFLLEAGLAAAGHRTGLIGTIETRIHGEAVTGARTTPESTDLQRLFRHMTERGVTAAAMEVSSHGLALGRVRGSRFAAVGFTNLSHDHLDFHDSLESYYRAKASLFDTGYATRGVVNLDDPAGRRLAAEAVIPLTGISVEGGPDDARPDDVRPGEVQIRVVATGVELAADGSRFVADLDGRRIPVELRLPGPFNVSNALMALALLDAAGVDPEAAAAGIGALRAVPGRMERVDAGQPFGVIVDYAHTPDALERVLDAARTVTAGRLVVVIGCGGDRDVAKRPLMGRVAAGRADVAVLTSDNPRSEDPERILDAVEEGARTVAGAEVVRWADRRGAIALALRGAQPGDVIVVAGKGHERVQELAHGTVPFDDRGTAREVLAGLGFGVPTDTGDGQERA